VPMSGFSAPLRRWTEMPSSNGRSVMYPDYTLRVRRVRRMLTDGRGP
jgi:hypothetical protein